MRSEPSRESASRSAISTWPVAEQHAKTCGGPPSEYPSGDRTTEPTADQATIRLVRSGCSGRHGRPKPYLTTAATQRFGPASALTPQFIHADVAQRQSDRLSTGRLRVQVPPSAPWREMSPSRLRATALTAADMQALLVQARATLHNILPRSRRPRSTPTAGPRLLAVSLPRSFAPGGETP